jgi:hypothetical protein
MRYCTVDTGADHVRVPTAVKESTQSPFDATDIVTPVASSIVVVQVPLVTVAACAGEAKKVDGIATAEKAKRLTAPTKANMVRVGKSRLSISKSYSEKPETVVNRE